MTPPGRINKRKSTKNENIRKNKLKVKNLKISLRGKKKKGPSEEQETDFLTTQQKPQNSK